MNCFKCDKECPEINGHEESPSGMYLNGVVDIIRANYGSDLDGDEYQICICDECIKSSKNVKYMGNYMENNIH